MWDWKGTEKAEKKTEIQEKQLSMRRKSMDETRKTTTSMYEKWEKMQLHVRNQGSTEIHSLLRKNYTEIAISSFTVCSNF